MPIPDNFGRFIDAALTWEDLANLIKDDMKEIKPTIQKIGDRAQKDEDTQEDIKDASEETAEQVAKMNKKFDKVVGLLSRLLNRNLAKEIVKAQATLTQSATEVSKPRERKEAAQAKLGWDMQGINKSIEKGLRGLTDQMRNMFRTQATFAPVQRHHTGDVVPIMNKLVQTTASGFGAVSKQLEGLRSEMYTNLRAVAAATDGKTTKTRVSTQQVPLQRIKIEVQTKVQEAIERQQKRKGGEGGGGVTANVDGPKAPPTIDVNYRWNLVGAAPTLPQDHTIDIKYKPVTGVPVPPKEHTVDVHYKMDTLSLPTEHTVNLKYTGEPPVSQSVAQEQRRAVGGGGLSEVNEASSKVLEKVAQKTQEAAEAMEDVGDHFENMILKFGGDFEAISGLNKLTTQQAGRIAEMAEILKKSSLTKKAEGKGVDVHTPIAEVFKKFGAEVMGVIGPILQEIRVTREQLSASNSEFKPTELRDKLSDEHKKQLKKLLPDSAFGNASSLKKGIRFLSELAEMAEGAADAEKAHREVTKKGMGSIFAQAHIIMGKEVLDPIRKLITKVKQANNTKSKVVDDESGGTGNRGVMYQAAAARVTEASGAVERVVEDAGVLRETVHGAADAAQELKEVLNEATDALSTVQQRVNEQRAAQPPPKKKAIDPASLALNQELSDMLANMSADPKTTGKPKKDLYGKGKEAIVLQQESAEAQAEYLLKSYASIMGTIGKMLKPFGILSTDLAKIDLQKFAPLKNFGIKDANKFYVFINNLSAYFNQALAMVGKANLALTDAGKEGFDDAYKLIQDKIDELHNVKVLVEQYHIKQASNDSTKKLAGGGFVPGPRVRRDMVPASLEPGSFVLQRDAVDALLMPGEIVYPPEQVKQIGLHNLHSQNKKKPRQKMAQGGLVDNEDAMQQKVSRYGTGGLTPLRRGVDPHLSEEQKEANYKELGSYLESSPNLADVIRTVPELASYILQYPAVVSHPDFGKRGVAAFAGEPGLPIQAGIRVHSPELFEPQERSLEDSIYDWEKGQGNPLVNEKNLATIVQSLSEESGIDLMKMVSGIDLRRKEYGKSRVSNWGAEYDQNSALMAINKDAAYESYEQLKSVVAHEFGHATSTWLSTKYAKLHAAVSKPKEEKNPLIRFVNDVLRSRIISLSQTTEDIEANLLAPLRKEVDLDRLLREMWLTPGTPEAAQTAKYFMDSEEILAEIFAEAIGGYSTRFKDKTGPVVQNAVSWIHDNLSEVLPQHKRQTPKGEDRVFKGARTPKSSPVKTAVPLSDELSQMYSEAGSVGKLYKRVAQLAPEKMLSLLQQNPGFAEQFNNWWDGIPPLMKDNFPTAKYRKFAKAGPAKMSKGGEVPDINLRWIKDEPIPGIDLEMFSGNIEDIIWETLASARDMPQLPPELAEIASGDPAIKKGLLARIKDGADRATNFPGAKQAKGWTKAINDWFYAKLEKRYGPKMAKTIMATSAGSGWGITFLSTLLTGIPISIPGQGILLGGLPMMLAAEAKKKFGKKKKTDEEEANVPSLAEGGIATRKTLAYVGDGGGPEAIIPLDQMPDAKILESGSRAQELSAKSLEKLVSAGLKKGSIFTHDEGTHILLVDLGKVLKSRKTDPDPTSLDALKGKISTQPVPLETLLGGRGGAAPVEEATGGAKKVSGITFAPTDGAITAACKSLGETVALKVKEYFTSAERELSGIEARWGLKGASLKIDVPAAAIEGAIDTLTGNVRTEVNKHFTTAARELTGIVGGWRLISPTFSMTVPADAIELAGNNLTASVTTEVNQYFTAANRELPGVVASWRLITPTLTIVPPTDAIDVACKTLTIHTKTGVQQHFATIREMEGLQATWNLIKPRFTFQIPEGVKEAADGLTGTVMEAIAAHSGIISKVALTWTIEGLTASFTLDDQSQKNARTAVTTSVKSVVLSHSGTMTGIDLSFNIEGSYSFTVDSKAARTGVTNTVKSAIDSHTGSISGVTLSWTLTNPKLSFSIPSGEIQEAKQKLTDDLKAAFGGFADILQGVDIKVDCDKIMEAVKQNLEDCIKKAVNVGDQPVTFKGNFKASLDDKSKLVCKELLDALKAKAIECLKDGVNIGQQPFSVKGVLRPTLDPAASIPCKDMIKAVKARVAECLEKPVVLDQKIQVVADFELKRAARAKQPGTPEELAAEMEEYKKFAEEYENKTFWDKRHGKVDPPQENAEEQWHRKLKAGEQFDFLPKWQPGWYLPPPEELFALKKDLEAGSEDFKLDIPVGIKVECEQLVASAIAELEKCMEMLKQNIKPIVIPARINLSGKQHLEDKVDEINRSLLVEIPIAQMDTATMLDQMERMVNYINGHLKVTISANIDPTIESVLQKYVDSPPLIEVILVTNDQDLKQTLDAYASKSIAIGSQPKDVKDALQEVAINQSEPLLVQDPMTHSKLDETYNLLRDIGNVAGPMHPDKLEQYAREMAKGTGGDYDKLSSEAQNKFIGQAADKMQSENTRMAERFSKSVVLVTDPKAHRLLENVVRRMARVILSHDSKVLLVLNEIKALIQECCNQAKGIVPTPVAMDATKTATPAARQVAPADPQVPPASPAPRKNYYYDHDYDDWYGYDDRDQKGSPIGNVMSGMVTGSAVGAGVGAVFGGVPGAVAGSMGGAAVGGFLALITEVGKKLVGLKGIWKNVISEEDAKKWKEAWGKFTDHLHESFKPFFAGLRLGWFRFKTKMAVIGDWWVKSAWPAIKDFGHILYKGIVEPLGILALGLAGMILYLPKKFLQLTGAFLAWAGTGLKDFALMAGGFLADVGHILYKGIVEPLGILALGLAGMILYLPKKLLQGLWEYAGKQVWEVIGPPIVGFGRSIGRLFGFGKKKKPADATIDPAAPAGTEPKKEKTPEEILNEKIKADTEAMKVFDPTVDEKMVRSLEGTDDTCECICLCIGDAVDELMGGLESLCNCIKGTSPFKSSDPMERRAARYQTLWQRRMLKSQQQEAKSQGDEAASEKAQTNMAKDAAKKEGKEGGWWDRVTGMFRKSDKAEGADKRRRPSIWRPDAVARRIGDALISDKPVQKFIQDINPGVMVGKFLKMIPFVGEGIGSFAESAINVLTRPLLEQMDYHQELRQTAFETEGINRGPQMIQQADGTYRAPNLGETMLNVKQQTKALEQYEITAETVLQTGQRMSVIQQNQIKLWRRGIREARNLNGVMTAGLNTGRMLGANAEETTAFFADMHHNLQMSVSDLWFMGRGLREVARQTGITGDNLIKVARSSETFMKNMRNAGTLTASASRNLIGALAEATKTGTSEGMNKIMETLSGQMLGGEGDQKTKNLIIVSTAGRGDLLQQAQTGTLMQNREGMRDLAEGMQRTLNMFTNGVDPAKMEPWKRAIADAGLRNLYGVGVQELNLLTQNMRQAGMSFAQRLEELDKSIARTSKNLTANTVDFIAKQVPGMTAEMKVVLKKRLDEEMKTRGRVTAERLQQMLKDMNIKGISDDFAAELVQPLQQREQRQSMVMSQLTEYINEFQKSLEGASEGTEGLKDAMTGFQGSMSKDRDYLANIRAAGVDGIKTNDQVQQMMVMAAEDINRRLAEGNIGGTDTEANRRAGRFLDTKELQRMMKGGEREGILRFIDSMQDLDKAASTRQKAMQDPISRIEEVLRQIEGHLKKLMDTMIVGQGMLMDRYINELTDQNGAIMRSLDQFGQGNMKEGWKILRQGISDFQGTKDKPGTGDKWKAEIDEMAKRKDPKTGQPLFPGMEKMAPLMKGQVTLVQGGMLAMDWIIKAGELVWEIITTIHGWVMGIKGFLTGDNWFTTAWDWLAKTIFGPISNLLKKIGIDLEGLDIQVVAVAGAFLFLLTPIGGVIRALFALGSGLLGFVTRTIPMLAAGMWSGLQKLGGGAGFGAGMKGLARGTGGLVAGYMLTEGAIRGSGEYTDDLREAGYIGKDEKGGWRGGLYGAMTGSGKITGQTFEDDLGAVGHGAAVGAGIGTLIAPGVGTALGAAIGGLVGVVGQGIKAFDVLNREVERGKVIDKQLFDLHNKQVAKLRGGELDQEFAQAAYQDLTTQIENSARARKTASLEDDTARRRRAKGEDGDAALASRAAERSRAWANKLQEQAGQAAALRLTEFIPANLMADMGSNERIRELLTSFATRAVSATKLDDKGQVSNVDEISRLAEEANAALRGMGAKIDVGELYRTQIIGRDTSTKLLKHLETQVELFQKGNGPRGWGGGTFSSDPRSMSSPDSIGTTRGQMVQVGGGLLSGSWRSSGPERNAMVKQMMESIASTTGEDTSVGRLRQALEKSSSKSLFFKSDRTGQLAKKDGKLIAAESGWSEQMAVALRQVDPELLYAALGEIEKSGGDQMKKFYQQNDILGNNWKHLIQALEEIRRIQADVLKVKTTMKGKSYDQTSLEGVNQNVEDIMRGLGGINFARLAVAQNQMDAFSQFMTNMVQDQQPLAGLAKNRQEEIALFNEIKNALVGKTNKSDAKAALETLVQTSDLFKNTSEAVRGKFLSWLDENQSTGEGKAFQAMLTQFMTTRGVLNTQQQLIEQQLRRVEGLGGDTRTQQVGGQMVPIYKIISDEIMKRLRERGGLGDENMRAQVTKDVLQQYQHLYNPDRIREQEQGRTQAMEQMVVQYIQGVAQRYRIGRVPVWDSDPAKRSSELDDAVGRIVPQLRTIMAKGGTEQDMRRAIAQDMQLNMPDYAQAPERLQRGLMGVIPRAAGPGGAAREGSGLLKLIRDLTVKEGEYKLDDGTVQVIADAYAPALQRMFVEHGPVESSRLFVPLLAKELEKRFPKAVTEATKTAVADAEKQRTEEMQGAAPVVKGPTRIETDLNQYMTNVDWAKYGPQPEDEKALQRAQEDRRKTQEAVKKLNERLRAEKKPEVPIPPDFPTSIPRVPGAPKDLKLSLEAGAGTTGTGTGTGTGTTASGTKSLPGLALDDGKNVVPVNKLAGDVARTAMQSINEEIKGIDKGLQATIIGQLTEMLNKQGSISRARLDTLLSDTGLNVSTALRDKLTKGLTVPARPPEPTGFTGEMLRVEGARVDQSLQQERKDVIAKTLAPMDPSLKAMQNAELEELNSIADINERMYRLQRLEYQTMQHHSNLLSTGGSPEGIREVALKLLSIREAIEQSKKFGAAEDAYRKMMETSTVKAEFEQTGRAGKMVMPPVFLSALKQMYDSTIFTAAADFDAKGKEDAKGAPARRALQRVDQMVAMFRRIYGEGQRDLQTGEFMPGALVRENPEAMKILQSRRTKEGREEFGAQTAQSYRDRLAEIGVILARTDLKPEQRDLNLKLFGEISRALAGIEQARSSEGDILSEVADSSRAAAKNLNNVQMQIKAGEQLRALTRNISDPEAALQTAMSATLTGLGASVLDPKQNRYLQEQAMLATEEERAKYRRDEEEKLIALWAVAFKEKNAQGMAATARGLTLLGGERLLESRAKELQALLSNNPDKTAKEEEGAFKGVEDFGTMLRGASPDLIKRIARLTMGKSSNFAPVETDADYTDLAKIGTEEHRRQKFDQLMAEALKSVTENRDAIQNTVAGSDDQKIAMSLMVMALRKITVLEAGLSAPLRPTEEKLLQQSKTPSSTLGMPLRSGTRTTWTPPNLTDSSLVDLVKSIGEMLNIDEIMKNPAWQQMANLPTYSKRLAALRDMRPENAQKANDALVKARRSGEYSDFRSFTKVIEGQAAAERAMWEAPVNRLEQAAEDLKMAADALRRAGDERKEGRDAATSERNARRFTERGIKMAFEHAAPGKDNQAATHARFREHLGTLFGSETLNAGDLIMGEHGRSILTRNFMGGAFKDQADLLAKEVNSQLTSIVTEIAGLPQGEERDRKIREWYGVMRKAAEIELARERGNTFATATRALRDAGTDVQKQNEAMQSIMNAAVGLGTGEQITEFALRARKEAGVANKGREAALNSAVFGQLLLESDPTRRPEKLREWLKMARAQFAGSKDAIEATGILKNIEMAEEALRQSMDRGLVDIQGLIGTDITTRQAKAGMGITPAMLKSSSLTAMGYKDLPGQIEDINKAADTQGRSQAFNRAVSGYQRQLQDLMQERNAITQGGGQAPVALEIEISKLMRSIGMLQYAVNLASGTVDYARPSEADMGQLKAVDQAVEKGRGVVHSGQAQAGIVRPQMEAENVRGFLDNLGSGNEPTRQSAIRSLVQLARSQEGAEAITQEMRKRNWEMGSTSDNLMQAIFSRGRTLQGNVTGIGAAPGAGPGGKALTGWDGNMGNFGGGRAGAAGGKPGMPAGNWPPGIAPSWVNPERGKSLNPYNPFGQGVDWEQAAGNAVSFMSLNPGATPQEVWGASILSLQDQRSLSELMTRGLVRASGVLPPLPGDAGLPPPQQKAVGTGFVQASGLAMLHRGEAILPAGAARIMGDLIGNYRDTGAFRTSSAGLLAPLMKTIQELQEVLSMLRHSNKSQALWDVWLRQQTGLQNLQDKASEAPQWYLGGFLRAMLNVQDEKAQATSSRDKAPEVKAKHPGTRVPDVEEELRRRRAQVADAEAKASQSEDLDEICENTSDTAQHSKDTAKAMLAVVRLLDLIRRILAGGGSLKGKKYGGIDIETLAEGFDLDEIMNTEWNMLYNESADQGMIVSKN